MGKTVATTIEVPKGYRVVRTWRVIDTDNFGRDYPNERFVAIGMSNLLAHKLAETLNAGPADSPRFYRVVEHIEIEYELIPGFVS